MKAIDRLYEYFEIKAIKPTALEKSLGLSNGYLGTQKKRNADMGESIVVKIVDYCSDLSLEWLLLGRGEMLYSNSPAANQTNDALLLTIIKEKDAKIEEQAKTIGRLEERIETLTKKSIDISDVEDVECVAASG